METAKPIKLTSAQIQEIAEILDCGSRCFYQHSTQTVKDLIDRDNPFYDPIEEEEQAWAEIEENPDDHIEIEKMSSSHSFDVMEAFIDEVEDPQLRARLVKALSRPKPFRNFKYEIDDSDYREKWFKFKKSKMIAWVEQQLDNHNRYS